MSTSSTLLVTPSQIDSTSTPHFNRPAYLMCSPQWYDVDYVINPWMAGNVHRSSRDLAFEQWKALYRSLQAVADVRLLHPEKGCPDMVFVGHTALVASGVAALSSFAHPQRRRETQPLSRWFREAGFLLWETQPQTPFEGEGDALFSSDGLRLWAAHGLRTCRSAHRHVADAWHVPVTSLQLTDPRFYHLDTCFAPLAGDSLMYFPGAFHPDSLALIESAYPAERRIAVSEADATRFACNAINIGHTLLVNQISDDLAAVLDERGFDVRQLDLSEFVKSGGAAKALALRLSDMEVTHASFGG